MAKLIIYYSIVLCEYTMPFLMIFYHGAYTKDSQKLFWEKQKVKIVFKVFVYLYITAIIIYFGGFVSKL
mgnify:CR=1 FL=1